jgi:hypothetical protein
VPLSLQPVSVRASQGMKGSGITHAAHIVIEPTRVARSFLHVC